MGTRKPPKAKAKKPAAAGSAPAAKPKAKRRKPSAASATTAEPATGFEVVETAEFRTLVDEDPNAELRIAMIAHAAYLRAEKRGFAPGKELDDWLAAAADVDEMLEKRGPR